MACHITISSKKSQLKSKNIWTMTYRVNVTDNKLTATNNNIIA